MLRARILGILLALTMPLTLCSQVDLYIAGDIVLSGINVTPYAKGNVIYNAGKINFHYLEIFSLPNPQRVDLSNQIAMCNKQTMTTGGLSLANAQRKL